MIRDDVERLLVDEITANEVVVLVDGVRDADVFRSLREIVALVDVEGPFGDEVSAGDVVALVDVEGLLVDQLHIHDNVTLVDVEGCLVEVLRAGDRVDLIDGEDSLVDEQGASEVVVLVDSEGAKERGELRHQHCVDLARVEGTETGHRRDVVELLALAVDLRVMPDRPSLLESTAVSAAHQRL